MSEIDELLALAGGDNAAETVYEEPPASEGTRLHIEAKRFVLQALFEKASSVVPVKDILPVLKNFQVVAESDEGIDRLRVVATNLELMVLASTEMVNVVTPGTVVFPAKKLLEILRQAEDDEMYIDVAATSEGLIADIAVGRTSWKLRLQSGDDYPPLPEVGELEFHEVDRVNFLGALHSVRYAVATDTARANLMMIDITDGKMTGCDGVRFQQALLGEDFPLSLQIPIMAVEDLVKMLRSTDLPKLGIGEADHFLVFRVGTDVFIANKLTAEFPDVEKQLLRPALENKDKLVVDRQELLDAVLRVRINADPESSAIRWELSENKLALSSRDKYGNASAEELDVAWSGPDSQVVLNHKFLTDMLTMYDGKACEFWLPPNGAKTRQKPVMLKDPETGTTGIVQQMRQDWAY